MHLSTQLSVILLIFLLVFFFACGVRHILPKLSQKGLALGAIYGLGILAILHLSTVLTTVGIPGVWVGECIFLIFVILGLKPGWIILFSLPKKWESSDVSNKLIWITALYYLFFWLWMLRHNISLPSYHDGVAHLSWFIDVHRSGYSYLSGIPLSFSEPFGVSQRTFYPTGMQAIIAIILGQLMRIGIEPTLILKSCQIFAHLSLVVSLLWGLKKHWPQIPLYLLLITSLISTTAFRFPMDASAEGGLARLVAFAAVLPLSLCLGFQRIFSLKSLGLVAATGLLPAFLLHPSLFWLLALSLGHAAFFTLKEDLTVLPKTPKSLWKTSGLWIFILGGFAAAVEILMLLKITGSQSEAAVIDQIVREAHSIIGKLSQVFQIGLSAMYAPQSAFRLLFHLGLIGIVILWRRQLITSRVASFHLTLFSFALLAMVSEVLPIPGGAYIGGAFYYHPARAACVVYIGVWLVALSAFPLLESWIQTGAKKLGTQKNLASLIKAFFIIWAVQFHVMIWFKLPGILERWDKEFHTPHWSNYQELIDTINARTTLNTVIVARPFDVDVLGAATGRESLFIYGDYITGRSENEKNKLSWYEAVVDSLKQTLSTQTDIETACTAAMAAMKVNSEWRFSRPITLILSEKDIDLKTLEKISEGTKVCRNIGFLGIKNNHAVFKIEDI